MSDPPVPPATKASSGPILVATDGTTAGEAAFRAAVLIAAKLSSSVHVMVVVEPLPVLVPDRAKELQKFAEELNAPAAARVEHVILSGAPSRAVLELAEENDADLIVAGTRGTGRMQRLLLGSVATRTDAPFDASAPDRSRFSGPGLSDYLTRVQAFAD